MDHLQTRIHSDNLPTMVRVHALVLMICSVIGFTGHYFQFGVMRLTPWIPAAAGMFMMILSYRVNNRVGFGKYLLLVPVFVFGVITTTMCFRFLPQEFQPMRKKIIFTLMSVSAWTTLAHGLSDRLKLPGQLRRRLN